MIDSPTSVSCDSDSEVSRSLSNRSCSAFTSDLLPMKETSTINFDHYIHVYIMEYGSTPYTGMATKKMAAPLYVYKVICSKLCPRLSHELLCTIPVILECLQQLMPTESIAEVPNWQVAKPANSLQLSSFF